MLLMAGCIGDLMACSVMVFAWWHAPVHRRAPSRRLWAFVALLFLGLAFEKALHLDAHIHDVLRSLATRNEVYGFRREAQVVILLVVSLCVALIMLRLRTQRGLPVEMRRVWLLGLLLVGLDAIRAVSLHQIDMILYASIGRAHLNHVLEGGLTALILYHTLRCLRAWSAMPRNGHRRSSG